MKLHHLFKKAPLKDHLPSLPPYHLVAQDFFAQKDGQELFIKKIFSKAEGVKPQGAVIFAPGASLNGNIFRMRADGELYALNHADSFANLLAADGFTVYIYNPSYTERIHNRYIARHCSESIYYQKNYEAPSALTFDQMVDKEVPFLIDFISQDSQQKVLSWIGYSLGGMLIYAYLAKYQDSRIRNVIAIGSPVSLNQIVPLLIGRINLLSKALGLEEKSFLGALSEHFVPLTRFIANFPSWLLRYNVLAPYIYNSMNITSGAVKSLMSKIVEPIPAGLENSFSHIINNGFYSLSYDFDYLKAMRSLQGGFYNFLFFFGRMDRLASPDSISLAHEIVSPGNNTNNLIGIKGRGHVDLVIGKHSKEEVWLPAARWLKEKCA